MLKKYCNGDENEYNYLSTRVQWCFFLCKGDMNYIEGLGVKKMLCCWYAYKLMSIKLTKQ